MMENKSGNSPIVYYISGREKEEWILFIHAAYVDHNMFRTQIDYFQDKYNILAIDVIGHGQSTAAQKSDRIDQMSAWTLEILQAEKIEKIHVVGISLGAILAQDFANHYPEKVSSLACFGGYDINNFDPRLQKQNGSAQMLMMLKALISVKWFAKANKKISAYTPQAQNDFYNMNIQFPKKSFLYLSALNSMVNAHPAQPRSYPLLIGCGAHDIPMELDAIEMWQQHEPNCKAIVFEHAGHCVNMDVPEAFNAALEKFWADGA